MIYHLKCVVNTSMCISYKNMSEIFTFELYYKQIKIRKVHVLMRH